MKTVKTILFALAFARVAVAQDDVAWRLLPDVKVDSSGIFLNQLVVPSSSSTVDPSTPVVLPHLRLAQAPILGQTASFSRNQIIELVQKYSSGLNTSNWSGATLIRVSRRTRQFTDSEMTDLLTVTLQRDYVKDRGELELHFARPMATALVPDEPLTLKVSELPATGIAANFAVRVELWNGKERVSDWQLSVLAKVWRDIPVVRSRVTRGQLLKDADIVLERRDILLQRDAFTAYPAEEQSLEFTESIAPGLPVLNRSLRVRPVIQRGRVVEGVYQDGSLSISLKVEALEDGQLGQTVRVRNPEPNVKSTERSKMSRLFSYLFNSTTVALLLITAQIGAQAADTLWKDARARSIFADKKAHSVGDVLTILIQENNGASRQNNTTTAKKASVDASLATFLYSPGASSLLTKGGQLPALKYASSSDFNGGGQIANQETITRAFRFASLTSFPTATSSLKAVVRLNSPVKNRKPSCAARAVAMMVAANNTILSYNIADASIQFISKGTITDSPAQGWFHPHLDKVSPF